MGFTPETEREREKKYNTAGNCDTAEIFIILVQVDTKFESTLIPESPLVGP